MAKKCTCKCSHCVKMGNVPLGMAKVAEMLKGGIPKGTLAVFVAKGK